MGEIRLVVADIDGTLVTRDKRVTSAALAAIQRLRNAGIKFTVISSRPPRGIQVVAKVVGLTDPVPAFNGGLVVGADLKTVLREKLLESVVAKRLIARLAELQTGIWVYTDKDWFVTDENGPYVQHEMHAVQYSPTVVKDFSGVAHDRVAKIVGVSEDFDGLSAVEKQLQQEFRGAVSATKSQKYYLDITHPSANKGEGVLLVSELLGIPTDNIATIGDMQNDVFMFRQSGLSIAMGNATDEVKATAQYVTSSNEEEGFANAMERYILGPLGQAASR
ncbi:MAG TPA: Cof-type HAD-IIB family hydrolase [Terriglobales bacterium]|nr:Cof-type HAD-IIB family hydrolase [Terriglobales bacterium]